MRHYRVLTRLIMAIVCSFIAVSCATVYSSMENGYNISGIYAEKRQNGYVLKIAASQKIGNVEAWVGNDDWLYMSIPDTSIDTMQLDNLEHCPMFSTMRLFRYTGSIQVTLRLKEKVDHVSVLSYPDDSNVYVVLYQFKEN